MKITYLQEKYFNPVSGSKSSNSQTSGLPSSVSAVAKKIDLERHLEKFNELISKQELLAEYYPGVENHSRAENIIATVIYNFLSYLYRSYSYDSSENNGRIHILSRNSSNLFKKPTEIDDSELQTALSDPNVMFFMPAAETKKLSVLSGKLDPVFKNPALQQKYELGPRYTVSMTLDTSPLYCFLNTHLQPVVEVFLEPGNLFSVKINYTFTESNYFSTKLDLDVQNLAVQTGFYRKRKHAQLTDEFIEEALNKTIAENQNWTIDGYYSFLNNLKLIEEDNSDNNFSFTEIYYRFAPKSSITNAEQLRNYMASCFKKYFFTETFKQTLKKDLKFFKDYLKKWYKDFKFDFEISANFYLDSYYSEHPTETKTAYDCFFLGAVTDK